jgi:hypothetical protein
LDASDVLDWLGAAAVFVAGKGTPTFGAITKPDGQKADFAVGNAGRFAIANGVHLSFFRPSAFGVAGLGRRLVVRSYGDVEAGVLGKLLVVPLPGDGITGTPLFQSAESGLGTGFSVNGFLDVQRFIDYLHDSGSIRSVASNLDPLSYVVAGSKAEGGTLTVRVVMGVK